MVLRGPAVRFRAERCTGACTRSDGRGPLSMNKPPAYQHYAKDWLVGTAQLTLEEQGAFLRLLDHQWERGPLEHDPKALARLLGVSVRTFGRLWKQLAPHFPVSGNGHGSRVANVRLEEQRAELAAYR